jgi:hypothetical protein
LTKEAQRERLSPTGAPTKRWRPRGGQMKRCGRRATGCRQGRSPNRAWVETQGPSTNCRVSRWFAVSGDRSGGGGAGRSVPGDMGTKGADDPHRRCPRGRDNPRPWSGPPHS